MSHPSISRSKAELRESLRGARGEIASAQRCQWNRQINEHLLSAPMLVAAKKLGAFWPFDGEPDLLPALTQLQSSDRLVAMPVAGEPPESSLAFLPWQAGQTMSKNRFGIPEPTGGDPVMLAALDVLLVPLVGWNRQGERLGMGLGFYDRAISCLTANSRPLLVGVAWSTQERQGIPLEPHDARLDAIITELGWLSCLEG